MMLQRNIKYGFTLIEVLVVICLVSIVAALAIPAVMQARESARRTECLNNLKQVTLAVNSHLDQKNYYPRDENAYSAFVFMLPFLENSALFNSINFSKHRPSMLSDSDVNSTAFSAKVHVFVCPSDAVTNELLGPVSYGGNYGTGVGPYGRPDNGPFASSLLDPKIRDSWVRDGLANTVAVSEFCRYPGSASSRSHHAVFQLGSYKKDQFGSMINDCTDLNINQHPTSTKIRGLCWGFDGMRNTSYDHNIKPNGNTCSCSGILAGAWTANSNHSNGVNCAHLDGHVSFVKNTITTSAWNSLGTMDGGEVTVTDP